MASNFEASEERWQSVFLIAAWFAVVTGICEGLGLLLFQRINSANWGKMVHVSVPIVWIAPILDFGIFILLALALIAVCKVFPRVPLTRTAALIYASFMAYIGLALTE